MEHDDAVENVSEHQVDPAEDIAEPDAKMAIKCTFWGLVWPQNEEELSQIEIVHCNLQIKVF